MPKLSYISQKTEQKLQECLSYMLDQISVGLSPQEALLKTAKDFSLSKDQIRIIGRAYNTGIVLNQLENKELDKKAGIPKLVDPEKTITELFSLTETPSPQIKVSSDYLLPPPKERNTSRITYELKKQAEFNRYMRKAAQQLELEEANKPTYQSRRDLVNNLLQEKNKAAIKIEQNLYKLANYFESEDAISPQEVIQNASLSYSKLASYLIGIIEDKIDWKRKYREFQPVDWDKPPYIFLKEACEQFHKLLEVSKKLEKLNPTKPAQRISVTTLNGGSVIDHMKKESCLYDAKISNLEKSGTIMSSISEIEGIAKALSATLPAVSTEIDVLQNLPERHQIAQARVIVTLADLLKNDPIISRHSEDEVKETYNELAKVAPMAMQSPFIIRRFLGRALEGGIDEYLLSELLKAEEKVREANESVLTGVFGGSVIRKQIKD